MNYIYNYTSFEKAYEVENYPWGFRLRTKVRYWIETNDKRSGGERFCKCTLNPKTGDWCKPKKSTYSPIKVMFLNEDNHVKHINIEMNNEEEKINSFIEKHKNNLTEYQLKTLKRIVSFNKAMENFVFKCEVTKTVQM